MDFSVRKHLHGSIPHQKHHSSGAGNKPRTQNQDFGALPQNSGNQSKAGISRFQSRQRTRKQNVKNAPRQQQRTIDSTDKEAKRDRSSVNHLKSKDAVTLTNKQLNEMLENLKSSKKVTGMSTTLIDDAAAVNEKNVERQEVVEGNRDDGAQEDIEDNGIRARGDNVSTQKSDFANRQPAGGKIAAPHDGKDQDKNFETTLSGVRVQKPPPSVGQSDISRAMSINELNDKAIAEQKRQLWKQELDAQVAAKKALKESNDKANRRQRGAQYDNSESWNPWGQVHNEAPPMNSGKTNGLSSLSKKVSGGGSSHTYNDDQPLGLHGLLGGQQSVPAAMRSSFLFGGTDGQKIEELNAIVKKKERESWLQELDQQRMEAMRRKEEKKHSQNAPCMQHWAEPVDPAMSQTSLPRNDGIGQIERGTAVESKIGAVGKVNREHPVSDPNPWNHPPHRPAEHQAIRMHIRPANTLIDPAEMERRELQRRKDREHIAAVQAQVEEKRRKKRETEEQRRREAVQEERWFLGGRDDSAQRHEQKQSKHSKIKEDTAALSRDLLENVETEDTNLEKTEKLKKRESHGDRAVDTLTAEHSPHQLQNPASVAASAQHDHSPCPVILDNQAYMAGMPSKFQDASTPSASVSTQTDHVLSRKTEEVRMTSAGRNSKSSNGNSKKDIEKEEHPNRRGQEDKSRKVPSKEGHVSDSSNPKDRRRGNMSKPKWGQVVSNKKKMMKNSEKDILVDKRAREERMKKRQEELLAAQEMNMSKRSHKSHKKQTKGALEDGSVAAKGSKANGILSENRQSDQQSSIPSRGKDVAVNGHDGFISPRSRQELRQADDRDDNHPPPEAHDGYFVPFMRTDDEALYDDGGSISSVPRSELSSPQRVMNSRKSKKSSTEMDPLLNPERLKDKEHRQEQILLQLSSLRQGLLMKQQEVEMSILSTPETVESQ